MRKDDKKKIEGKRENNEKKRKMEGKKELKKPDKKIEMLKKGIEKTRSIQ